MADAPKNPAPDEDQASVRLDKLRHLEALGIDPWGQRFDGHTPIGEIRLLEPKPFDDANPQGQRVIAAGRVLRHRTGGKLHFLELWDQTGRIQLMIRVNKVGELDWKILNLLDLGDIVGVAGEFGKTKTGELTIQVDKLTFLTKSLEPHPKDVFGLGDMEFRLRHRYLDMIYTPDTLRRAHQRVKIVRTIRNHLDAQGYVEVETPTLHAIAGGAAARPFATHHNALDIDLFVRIALELPLKRLLVGGLEKVYEIGRVFRNEGISPRHNPEFTMLELYCAYGDLFSIMDLTEAVFSACVDAIVGESLPLHNESRADLPTPDRVLPYGERRINFAGPWPRVLYSEIFKQAVGVDLFDEAGVKAKALANGLHLEQRDAKAGTSTPKQHEVLVHELFEHLCEPKIGASDQPTFVYDYPAALCPLTKRKRENPKLAERFELYIAGMELANAYTELNDPITQEVTFRQQLAGMNDEDSMAKMDDDFVRALRHGMPPAGGLGIGIDRLVMLLTNTTTIRDVILFPLLRPEAK